MSEKAFASSRGGAPFPRSEAEWIEKGMEPNQAKHRIRQEVFGHDYQVDAKDEPIEKGKGSPAQQTQQHLQALDMTREADRARSMRLGYHPGLEGAFDAKVQDQIDRAVAAALAKAGAKPRKKPGRKPKAEPTATAAA